ncbi:MAG: ArsA-related P-loop ATPase [Mobilicoccus sp.]|nr:ArsA-related P-loop ATPase [Mobilicoccus sp.]
MSRPGSRRPHHLGADSADTPFDVDALLADPDLRIIVCCGSGGVGKTTTAAAMAVRAAESGRRVAVLTIDPARRLAQSLGLERLDNTPRAVEGLDLTAGGSLDALMLDMKRTFDEVVAAHSTPEKAEQIFANPFYEALSSSFAGTQEYMAMEKLGQLHALTENGRPRWDLVVVDTPPSRSALDFLDAPSRLGSFLDGRFIRVLLAPARAGGRAYTKMLGVGVTMASGVLSKILGASTLEDVRSLVAALDTMFGGFRQRADETFSLLQRSETAFVVVASPEPDALREAGYFVDRLVADAMPLAGVVINRVRRQRLADVGEDAAIDAAARLRARADRQDADSADVGVLRRTAEMLEVHAQVAAQARRHRSRTREFAARHSGVAVSHVPVSASDIHDLDGLREIGEALASHD